MKKILTATLALLLLLTGCKKTDPVKPDPTPAPTSDRQKEFNDLQLEWFKDEVGSDFVNLHFTLEDPSKYGIEKPEVTLGEVHYGINEDDKKDIQEIKDKLAKLDTFKPEELTEDQQIMLECMRYSLELSLELYEYEDDYTFTFSPNSGVNSNLTTNFTEFAIRDEQDIKDLITLLNDTGRYIDECITYTRTQAEKGIIQTDNVMDSIVEQCSSFISKVEDNEIVLAFEDAIEPMNLAGKDEYTEQVKTAVREVVVPAYQRIIDLYAELKGKATKSGAMAEYGETGKKEYATLLKLKTSTDKSVEELEAEVEEGLQQAYMTIIRNLNFDETEGYGFNDTYEILDFIKTKMAADFPEIPDVKYTIDFLDETVTSENISAYYLIAPLDNINQNVIKVNPLFVERDPDGLCITLAHEGYPGHCYQNTYYMRNHPGNEYRSCMSFLGYAEGWAEYCETLAYGYFLDNGTEINYLQGNNIFSYLMYTYCDMLVNYDGYSVDDLADFLSTYFVGDYAKELAADLFDTVIGDPGLFCPYGYGLYKMWNLMQDTKSTLGKNFDMISYNKVILDTGEAPFPILEARINKYIEDKQ